MAAVCTKYFNDAEAEFSRSIGIPKHPSGYEMEIDNFKQTGALWPPASVAQVDEPLLQIDRKGAWKNGKACVCHHCKVNVTLTVDGWTVGDRWEWVYGTIGFGPFEVMKELYKLTKIPPPKNKTSLYEYMAPLFHRAAQLLQQLRDRLTVEVIP
ncbi:MAG: hypothetical protein L6R42_001303 [Xanthoria sp. 1 TBL-2021]|nr:MAG: hypothetical protein L6R42_001303 [Xanthoria sp. 1 TBL-2021]